MRWPGPLLEATFIQRYKRFFADFSQAAGHVVTAHCANTGSMRTCMAEGARAWLTRHEEPKRKLPYSWQAIAMPDGWVGINTSLANALVREAIVSGTISELAGYSEIAAERKYGERSRVDLLLSAPGRRTCFVEVKNVTLLLEPGVAAFPDAVTARGRRHLEELAAMCDSHHRAVLIYCVQRESARTVAPARAFDPAYADALAAAVARGLEVFAYRAAFHRDGPILTEPLPLADMA